jgi:hypothetical protein
MKMKAADVKRPFDGTRIRSSIIRGRRRNRPFGIACPDDAATTLRV